MSACNSKCSECGVDCGERREPQSMIEKGNEFSDVKKVIGVVSGKGGVGKSMVTSLLASAMSKRGNSVAILDADITGPSIPKTFGIKEKAKGDGSNLYPEESSGGIKIMSTNLILENDSDPVVWRGPIVAGAVKQFWSDVVWGNVDYMFVDMPPGTGDVALTVFQSLPVDGIIVVTSPQELVGMIVDKGVKMAEMLKIPVLAVVENMSYFECTDCGKKHNIFGDSHVEKLAASHGIGVVAKMPIDPSLTKACDDGKIETVEQKWLNEVLDKIESC